jgi:hypothetical protein
MRELDNRMEGREMILGEVVIGGDVRILRMLG